MDVVKRALLKPREKADTVAFAFSLLTALIATLKSLWVVTSSLRPPTGVAISVPLPDMIMVLLGGMLMAILSMRYAHQRSKPSEIHDIAIAHINELFPGTEQSAAPPAKGVRAWFGYTVLGLPRPPDGGGKRPQLRASDLLEIANGQSEPGAGQEDAGRATPPDRLGGQ